MPLIRSTRTDKQMAKGSRFFTAEMCDTLVQMLTSKDKENIYLAVASIQANINCVVYADKLDDLKAAIGTAYQTLGSERRHYDIRFAPQYWSKATRKYVGGEPLTEEDAQKVRENKDLSRYQGTLYGLGYRLKEGKRSTKKTNGKDS
jgi:hypothetical protein